MYSKTILLGDQPKERKKTTKEARFEKPLVVGNQSNLQV